MGRNGWEAKNKIYGCYDCADYQAKTCKPGSPCQYAGTLDKFQTYSDFVKQTGPSMATALEAVGMAKAQRWKSMSLMLKNLDTGELFRTIGEAERKTGACGQDLSRHLLGYAKSVNGHRWAWVEV